MCFIKIMQYTSVIVAISYNFDEYKDDTNETILNELFDYSLEELNKQILAYVICTKDDSCFISVILIFIEIITYRNNNRCIVLFYG